MPDRFSASSAAKQMACHASANLETAIPGYVAPVRDPNVGGAAQAGTDVHEVIHTLIMSKTVTPKNVVKFSAKDLRAVGEAMLYIADVWSRRRFQVLSEVSVKALWSVSLSDTTADLVLYTQDELHIIDIKWGKIPVEVVGNEQLLFYAASYAHLAPIAKQVTLHIVQPRADNMESWVVTAAQLKQFMADAVAADTAIQGGSVTFGPSDHCMFCPAFPHSRAPKGSPLCPAQMDLLYPAYRVDESSMLSDL